MARELALKESHVEGKQRAGFSSSYNLMCGLSGFKSSQRLSVPINKLESRTERG